ncbi:MAG: right-handed parallel beta-helix repeat-containing protein [Chitinophagaceae bacterium]
MRNLSYSLFLLVFFHCPTNLVAQTSKPKKIYLVKGGDGGILVVHNPAIHKAGDTLVVKAGGGPYTYIYLGKFTGTKQAPYILVNEGGVVSLIEDCQHLKVSGSGGKERYGFAVNGTPGTAVAIHGKSAHIEVERLYIKEAAFGCWIKNEASCDTVLNNWVLNDISIHDYEMHQIRIEGFYMGSTDANNKSRPITCGSIQRFYRPTRLGNIRIYNGVINGTGRPAIMLSNASVGMSEIYNNKISNVGREFNDQQGTGIAIGLYTRAYVHHNQIKNTYTWGIASLGGSGYLRIEDNSIDSSGYLDGRTLSWPWNILVDTRETFPIEKTRFSIKNNKLGKSGNPDNIYIGKTVPTYDAGNVICNNTVAGKPARVDVESGIAWYECESISKGSQSKVRGMILPGVIILSLFGVFMFVQVRYSQKKVSQEFLART